MYLDYIYSSQFPFKYLNIEFCLQRDVYVQLLNLEFIIKWVCESVYSTNQVNIETDEK